MVLLDLYSSLTQGSGWLRYNLEQTDLSQNLVINTPSKENDMTSRISLTLIAAAFSMFTQAACAADKHDYLWYVNNDKDNSDLSFDLQGYDGTTWLSNGLKMPRYLLDITSKNNTPVTLVGLKINRGSCGWQDYKGPHANLQYGQTNTVMITPYSCHILEVTVFTKEGKVTYQMQDK